MSDTENQEEQKELIPGADPQFGAALMRIFHNTEHESSEEDWMSIVKQVMSTPEAIAERGAMLTTLSTGTDNAKEDSVMCAIILMLDRMDPPEDWKPGDVAGRLTSHFSQLFKRQENRPEPYRSGWEPFIGWEGDVLCIKNPKMMKACEAFEALFGSAPSVQR